MLTNLFTQSPEALEAQKAQKEADRTARKKELDRLQKDYDRYTNEKIVRNLLPEDVEYAKKFLRERIVKLQTTPAITEDQLIAYMDDKAAVNFRTKEDAMPARYNFYTTMAEAKGMAETTIDAAKKNKTPPPKETLLLQKTADDLLAWFKKTKFETKDVYDTKLKAAQAEYAEKAKGANLEDPQDLKKRAESEIKEKSETFSLSGLFSDVSAYVGGYLGLALIFIGVLLGASLASNLNVYRNWTFRLFYALYGALFFFVVIPYSLFYRWLLLGKRPKFYAMIPLVPYHWNNRIMQILFGWISFRPDSDIYALKEWENVAV